MAIGARFCLQGSQVFEHLFSGLVARLNPFLERLHRNPVKFGRNARIDLRRWWWIDMNYLSADLNHAGA